jgi:hypothetical protein
MRLPFVSKTRNEAKKLGIGKSTLHYLRKHAKNRQNFKLYDKVRTKLSISPVSYSRLTVGRAVGAGLKLATNNHRRKQV